MIHGIEDNNDADFKPYRRLETPLSPRRTYLLAARASTFPTRVPKLSLPLLRDQSAQLTLNMSYAARLAKMTFAPKGLLVAATLCGLARGFYAPQGLPKYFLDNNNDSASTDRAYLHTATAAAAVAGIAATAAAAATATATKRVSAYAEEGLPLHMRRATASGSSANVAPKTSGYFPKGRQLPPAPACKERKARTGNWASQQLCQVWETPVRCTATAVALR
eukprot:4840174-Pleurochrysis_carterae.AAC.1